MSRPYSQLLESLLGNMYPEFIAKPKPVHTHHSFLKELITAVASVVVGIAFPALALSILNVAGSLMTALVTGAAEGLANAVSQGVAIGLEGGHFSIKQVFQTAAEAALTAGIAKVVPIGQTAEEAARLGHSAPMVQQLLAQAKVIVANELAEMAAGNKKAFDIRTLVSSVVASAAELQINPTIGAVAGNVGVNVVDSTLSNLAADLATHSPIRVDLIAAQAAGMSIGDAVVTHLTPKQENYHQAQQASQGKGRSDPSEPKSSAHLWQGEARDDRDPQSSSYPSPFDNKSSARPPEHPKPAEPAKRSIRVEDLMDAQDVANVPLPGFRIETGVPPASASISNTRAERWQAEQAAGSQSKLLSKQGFLPEPGSKHQDERSSLEWTHHGLAVAGVATGAGEFSNVMEGQWKGVNGKWYNLAWGGNAFTGSRTIPVKRADMFNRLGWAGFIADSAIEIPSAYSAYKSGNYADAGKSTLDFIMGGVALTGPLGLAVSGAYTAVDFTIGWKNVPAIVVPIEEANRRITGRGIWEGPKL